MSLYTPFYLLFLLTVVVLYWLLPGGMWRKLFLLGASYLFYALVDLRFVPILLGLSLITFFVGRSISNQPRARYLLWIGIITNLGTLVLYKYFNFFVDNVAGSLSALGVHMNAVTITWLLPIGISFYTFQSISYLVEVKRGKVNAEGNLIDFLLYLTFFPKLIAGPLVKPEIFLHQEKSIPISLDKKSVQSSLGLLLLGLVKKMVIADSLASQSVVAFRAAALPVDDVSFPTPLFMFGFYLYAFQIYADFSGYTDIARASAKLLGYRLPENFQQPYLSSTITMFWNRWHMTLTQWFREYLFYPLSRHLLTVYGRKYQRSIQVITTLITMGLIGLWHGAAWTFICWGIWHGALLCIERFATIKNRNRWITLIRGVLVFHLVGIGWILFGSTSMPAAVRFLRGLFAFEQMDWLSYYLPPVILTALLVFGIDIFQRLKLFDRIAIRFNWKAVVVTAAVVVLVGLYVLNIARGEGAYPFIYGQF